MYIEESVFEMALEQYQEIYMKPRSEGGKDWQIPWVLWKYGEQAFSGSGDSTAFNQLYEELRVNWYVFRAAKSVKTPKSA